MDPSMHAHAAISDCIFGAHYFISEQYWTSNYELVKEMMSQAEIQ